MEELMLLKKVTYDDFLHHLKCEDIAGVVFLRSKVDTAELRSLTLVDDLIFEEFRQRVESREGLAILKDLTDPYFALIMENKDDVFMLGQWPLSREQTEYTNYFFAQKQAAGNEREQVSSKRTDVLYA
ncbi:uncharacterized protein PHALS_03180 [Plasmopara halstedii]|uniref:Uncharacterized protein n=1 Tax=Plasmopara halstedii TaxID=4781 RepID=A0A0P1A501_PLAHL|nr:uncharacterized protein PHALS_03180 [Plasmopara halstedii]CEG35210.1 hypothetical protein PHALS_03180 [Plasmopara halstedii]|eukprot:XP_024571579.1 hypothetical protein PHALS_03180 [Plasmopara halstedii]